MLPLNRAAHQDARGDRARTPRSCTWAATRGEPRTRRRRARRHHARRRAPAPKVVYAEGVRDHRERRSGAQDAVELGDPGENRAAHRGRGEGGARGRRSSCSCIGDERGDHPRGVGRQPPRRRASLDLVGQQDELADAMLELGKPVVVVLINGRPVWRCRSWPGSANAHRRGAGTRAGGRHAIGDVLFGDVNPGGKLPITHPARCRAVAGTTTTAAPTSFRPYLDVPRGAAVAVRLGAELHDVRAVGAASSRPRRSARPDRRR